MLVVVVVGVYEEVLVEGLLGVLLLLVCFSVKCGIGLFFSFIVL